MNSGYHCDGSIDRTIKNEPVTFNTFAATGLAGIGTVPLPLARRSIVIPLKRDPNAPRTRQKFNRNDKTLDSTITAIYVHLAAWARGCQLNLDPEMPRQLTGGQCDNWRPLIAVADACDPAVGTLAREIAVKMCRGLDEDFAVILLRDIRSIFAQQRADRLASSVILEHLLLQPHGLWSDWRGKDNTDAPRKLTYGIMAKLLDPFGIRSRTIRLSPAWTAQGFHRYPFEDAWKPYCPEDETDTSTQPSEIKHIACHLANTVPDTAQRICR